MPTLVTYSKQLLEVQATAIRKKKKQNKFKLERRKKIKLSLLVNNIENPEDANHKSTRTQQ